MEKEIYAYRLLTKKQAEQAINGEDIIADDPHAETSIQEHLLRRLSGNPTPYLSASAWLPGILGWAFEKDNLKSTLIRIKLDENIDYIDVRDGEHNEKVLGLSWRANNYAQTRREILIIGKIPKENYRIIRHGEEHNTAIWKIPKRGLGIKTHKQYEKCKNKQERIELLTDKMEKDANHCIENGFTKYKLKNLFVCISYLNLENTKNVRWDSVRNTRRGLNNI